ncbi:hypothetical protein N7513_008740 [Penicillium frequentans]|nr:hypothetical protein N7513_008740 [Penicillium glabrum]
MLEETDLEIDIRKYEIFKTKILTPDDYVEICEGYDAVHDCEHRSDMEFLSDDHPSYTRVYKTLRRECAEQQQIIEAKRDLSLVSLAFKLLSNLEILNIVFQQTGSHEDWEADYHLVYGMTEHRSYDHHIQLLLAALQGSKVKLKAIRITHLEPRDEPPSGSWDPLTIPLKELVAYAPALQLVQSGLPLVLLRQVDLKIRDLEVCSIYMELTFIESFLKCNVRSLRSFGVQKVQVIDQGKLTPLTATHVGNIIGLEFQREKVLDDFFCSRSFQKGWKVLL